MKSNLKTRVLNFLRWILAVMVVPVAFLSLPATKANASLKLSQAVEQALLNNHNLAAKQHAHTATIWAERHARAQLLPSLSLSTSYTRLDDETVKRANVLGGEMTFFFPDSSGQLQSQTVEIPQTVFRDGYQTNLTAQLLLFNAQVWNGVSITGASEDLAAWQEIGTRQETVHQTLLAFVELLKINSLTDIQTRHLSQSQENTALARRLFSVGRYAEADILRWQVEEARQRGLLAQQSSAQRITALNLENMIGAPANGQVVLDSILPHSLVEQIDRFEQMSTEDWDRFNQQSGEQLTQNNPTMAILNCSEHLFELQHRASKIQFLPSIALQGSYGWQDNNTIDLDGEKTWSASVVLSMPLFTSGSNYSELQVTRYQLLQTRESNQNSRQELFLAAEAAKTTIQTNVELLSLARASLSSARRNHDIMHNNYTLGRLTNLEWLDANLTLQATEQGYIDAYYELVVGIADYFNIRGEIASLFK